MSDQPPPNAYDQYSYEQPYWQPFPEQPYFEGGYAPASAPPPASAPWPNSHPPQPASADPEYRPLNVQDALSYLDLVKIKFRGQPEVYNRFLDIMKDFKSQTIDTPGVIQRVSSLFRAHAPLIQGFNTFLPPGFSLEATNNPADPVRVSTPKDHPPYVHQNQFVNHYVPEPELKHQIPATGPPQYQSQTQAARPIPPITQHISLPPMGSIPAVAAPGFGGAPYAEIDDPTVQRQPLEFNHAITYVNKIKNRYVQEPEVYRQFLEILQAYQKDQRPIQEVYKIIQVLFKTTPDLLDEFKQFMPDTDAPVVSESSDKGMSKKQARRQVHNNLPPTNNQPAPNQHLPPPKKRARAGRSDKPNTMEEIDFFERCKRVIGNKSVYNEFLKILNLFSQEIIESKVLIERVEPFLGKSPELFDWFKKFVKYEDEDIIYNIPADRPVFDLQKCRKSGHSYRRLPKNVPRPVCSGRDELCKDVLSDDWVSHPVFVSESGFLAHKKTIYEEAVFKCEEERYEFDLNIESNLHVIRLMEPIAAQIRAMNSEQRASFKLAPGLGGTSLTIYQRVIKKIYDSERGLEVIEALHDNPTIAVPVVLRRLKQKDEEWKRAQREWKKVWSEIDVKNFSKALDHQGIHFKLSDRKAILVKSLTSDIEVLAREQREKQSTLANRYQFDFVFKRTSVYEDARKLIAGYMTLNPCADDEKILNLMNDFLPSFLFVNDASGLGENNASSEDDFDEDAMEIDSDNNYNLPDDLVPATIDSTAAAAAILSGRPRSSFSFYANTPLYALFRLYQMLFSRLVKMKEVSEDMQTRNEIPRSHSVNPTAVEMGLVKQDTDNEPFKDRYKLLLKWIRAFVAEEMDPNEFEEKTRLMFWTNGYLIFTVDRLIQAIVKQSIAVDSRSLELIQTYRRDREKITTSSRQEALFRLCAESIIHDDNIYRFEFFVSERVLTVQLLSKEDQICDDSISSEEKWSLYVDQFVQLTVTEGVDPKRREPFLKRNLPTEVGEEPPLNVETRSGLELKICVNTYKIFFVDNTEDYFHRQHLKPATPAKLLNGRERRKKRFAVWLESPLGWSKDISAADCGHCTRDYETWVKDCRL